jgi:hypothetical protein
LWFNNPWAANAYPNAEVQYNLNGILLGSICYSFKKGANFDPTTDTNFNAVLSFWSDDNAGISQSPGNIIGSGNVGITYYTAVAPIYPYAVLQFRYSPVVSSGVTGLQHDLWYTTLALYGRHGLALRGPDPGGFYPGDIALNAMGRSRTNFALGQIDDSSGYILNQSVYADLTTPEQIIDDMAKLMGWHWGVWEPSNVFSSNPTFYFCAPPTDATCSISREDCIELDVPKVRLDLLYDTAIVSYSDVAGASNHVTVTLPNPILAEAGVSGRTLTLNLGIGSAASATTFGMFALRLGLRTARGGGSAILPQYVSTPGGMQKPSCLLKAGRDRIRITDLPDNGPSLETDTRRFDTFHVSRVEVTVDAAGVPQTRVEFDGGADLMEVLQARLAVAATLAQG